MIGIGLGWALSGGRPPSLLAGGGDRWDAPVALTAPIATEASQAMKIQLSEDAIYYLNYTQGTLLAAVPMLRQTPGASQMLSEFAVRDLIADFQLPKGITPHFVMTAGSLGVSSNETYAPLYVFETQTGQLAVYRVKPQATATSTQPAFVLLERRSDPRLARPKATVADAR